MLIGDLASSGALPVLGEVYAFAGQRQRVLAHNIANIDTPGFLPLDVSVEGFRASLAKAVEERRGRTGGQRGELRMRDSKEVEHVGGGGMALNPRTPSGNVLYHDRSNRDLERMMQGLAENTLAFRLAGDLIRRENDLLRTAISQRV